MTAAIRPATPDDLDPIMAIERASFPTDAWSTSMMRDTLRARDAVAHVAHDDGLVVGYAAMLATRGGDAEVMTIAVADAWRGRGLGRALLGVLLAAAAERRAPRVFLEVRADNPVAQALYESLGFERIGRRPRYYQPDDVDAIVMRLDLPREATPTREATLTLDTDTR